MCKFCADTVYSQAADLYLNYQKGSLFLDSLRSQVGDQVFRDGLRQYLEWYRFGVGRPQGFFEAMQQASRQDLRPLFAEWVGLENLR